MPIYFREPGRPRTPGAFLPPSTTVLMIDHDEERRAFLVDMLRQIGVRRVATVDTLSDVAASLPQIFAAAHDHKPAHRIIFLGRNPDAEDVFDGITKLTAQKDLANLPIVMVDDGGDPAIRLRAWQAGIDAILVPPLTAPSMRTALSMVTTQLLGV